ncbi:unnamed protein product [Schistosoma turkestanicum]|nr:unnamed protein product [Schistosoma turkestanicum]
MVWANTTDIGCGVAYCSQHRNTFIVCNYGPGGNWNRQKPYEVKSRDLCHGVQGFDKHRNKPSHTKEKAPIRRRKSLRYSKKVSKKRYSNNRRRRIGSAH